MTTKAFFPQLDEGVLRYLTKYCGVETCDTPRDADLLVFTGGGDVDPELYGEENTDAVGVCRMRDDREKHLFDSYPDLPKLGICRGSQLMWVLNGGKLHQHIEGHAIAGTHYIDETRFIGGRNTFLGSIGGATSTHHQAAFACSLTMGRVIAWGPDDVVEAHYHEDTKTLGIQGHPEYRHASDEYKQWCADKINNLLINREIA